MTLGTPGRVAAYTALAGLALLIVAPVAMMVAGSLKPDQRVLAEMGSLLAFFPGDSGLENYRNVFDRVAFGRYLLNSLWIASVIVVGGLVVNSAAGYALARLPWPGRPVALLLVLAVMIVPLEAIAVPLFYLVTLAGWRDTYSAQTIPFIANAFSIYLFYTFFKALPRELEEAARVDGAGVLRTFLNVVVPNAKPAFASVAILSFLTQWGTYLWPVLVTSGEKVRPLPLAVAAFYTLPPLQWGDIFAFGVMMVGPVMLVFMAFQGWFVRGVAAAAVKG